MGKVKLSIIISCIFIFMCIINGNNVFAEDTTTVSTQIDGDWWVGTVENEQLVKIHLYTMSEDACVTVPNKIGNYYVSGISEKPFFDFRHLIKEIKISEGISTIGDWAFYDCFELTSVEIPNGVLTIKKSAFRGCISLTSIKIPKSVSLIENSTFAGCNSLTNIEVDSNNNRYSSENGILFNKEKTKLEQYPRGKGKENYIIQDSVTHIADNAFYGASSLKSIEISDNVKEIGKDAFYDCSGLTNIEVDSNNNCYSSENGILFNKEKTSLIKYPEGKEEGTYIIPDSVTQIESCAFKCLNLEKVYVKNNNICLLDDAFYYSDLKIYISDATLENDTPIEEYASKEEISIYRDAAAPVLMFIPSISGWTTRNITYRIIPNDGTGVGTECVYANGEKLTPNISGEYSYTANDGTTIEFISEDKLGNKRKYEQKPLIDKSLPIITSVTGNSSTWTKEDITLKVNATDTESGIKEYSFDGGVTWGTSNTKTYSQNTSGILIKVKDNVGNISTHNTINITTIDKTKPALTVTGNPTEWVKSATLTIKASDVNSGLKSVTVNGTDLTMSSGVGEYKITKNGLYTVVATDNAGTTTTRTTTVTYIDATAPTIIKTLVDGEVWKGANTSEDGIEWTNKSREVEIKAIDNGSGIKDYSFDGGKTWQASNKKTFSENTKNILVMVRDNIGNKTENNGLDLSKVVNIMKIDKTKPALTVTGEATLTIKASDSNSGIKSVTVNGTEVKIINGTGTYVVTENGAYKIVATDNAGNIEEINKTINSIDKTAPKITSVTGNPTSWTNKDVTLKVIATDDESGIKEYSFDGGKTWGTSNTKKYTQNTSGIEIQVKDNVGNIAKHETINITKIDKTAPTLTAKGDITLTIKASDLESGLKNVTVNGTEVKMENGQGTYTATKNEEYKIIATDNAGNIKEETKTVNAIKKLESISIKTMPTKTSYNKGETLNTKGLVLNLIYDNGTKEEVTTGYTCTPMNLDNVGNEKITVTYEGKTTTFEVTVSGRNITITSEEYGLKEKHIAKIKPQTDREEFKKNITTNATMKIYDRNGTEIKETDMIATGMKMKLALDGKTEEYKIVVRGDLTGDGKIGNADLLKMARHIVGLEKELKDEYLEAADINLDEKLGNNIDLLKMSRVLVGLDNL